MGSLFKKIKSLAKYGIEPIEEGKNNYQLNITEIELKAKKRSKTCQECDNFVEEPIDMFRVKDERIFVLSEMMCNDCGCTSTYLLRQNLKICKYWKK